MANNNQRKVTINVYAKDFVVTCSNEFANHLEDEIALISGGTGKIELANFINAFVKLSYENYIVKKELNKIITTIDKEIKENAI
ncbi:hypothetical protein FVD15_00400 [Campylobacter volucris]|uniref:Uncharacterized protein n=1 Tax=Campylobacter volucris TaxID=1031542 RepID=A0AAE5YH12_9BACT|nr:hypothetical protein [Campylobacter volucris]AJC94463.1 hypothetical protein CVOL_1161 [Campylobacter volucris LMG 24379]KAB0578974.1 hypothetical protein F7P61_06185 [Campylobacter volucris]MBF7042368.1 hypothetical protein [Campylobacter volucris]MBF7044135.1 hypothetical protein [Campylobacter volucris]MBF7045726.1 hypothetical protein [Campylobacter volucris]